MVNTIRKPWIAGLLTFFSIGLGHVYAGEAKRGIFLFLGQGILFLIFFILSSLLIASPTVILILFIGCSVGYFIFCLLNSIKVAQQNKAEYQLKKYNRWYVYLAYWVVASLIIQPIVTTGFKEYIIQAYKIQAGSMLPTLKIGDMILVNKNIYKFQTPKRGDVVVFEFPKDPSEDYIKRIIAVGGDTVEIRNKILYLNGIQQKEISVINTSDTIFSSAKSPRDNFGPITVSQNAIFLLGDNRDNSFDSRFWGTVNENKIKGKAICLYWSWDGKNSSIRWNRIGKTIQ